MIIAVNTRLLVDNLHGGIEWFSYEILSRITRWHPEHSFVFIFDRPFNDTYLFSSNIIPVVARPRASHPFLWYIWNQVSIPGVLKRTGADIYISPDGTIPLGIDIPSISVIHDISFVHRNNDLPFLKSEYYRRFFPRFARQAAGIITVSEFSASDISSTFGIKRSAIDVVYNGASEEFYPDPGPLTTVIPAIQEERPFFLFVGNLSPRKNVPNLIRAYNRYRETSGNNPMLIIAGNRFYLNSELDSVYRRSPYRSDIIFTGSMTQEQLRRLYSNALALVFIPWFEGFGIPVVEAMRCGTPVIASDATSIPEISGDAAILVSPGSPDQIAAKMKEVTVDHDMRERMITKGYINANRFAWEEGAVSFWNSVDKIIKTI